MAHVVTSACFGCKYTDCVAECPVDAFREGEKMLYIDPEVCICCDQCVLACPVEAIFAEDDVPEDQREFISLNAEMAIKCPPIVEKKKPLCEQPAE
jgi:ferredoxin